MQRVVKTECRHDSERALVGHGTGAHPLGQCGQPLPRNISDHRHTASLIEHVFDHQGPPYPPLAVAFPK